MARENTELQVVQNVHRHREEHVFGADTVRDIVIGMSDGLTVPFALAAGLSGAISNTNLIIIAGLAEIAAGSIAMGLGGYLAGKTEVDHYNSEMKREYDEVENVPEVEKQEIRTFLSSLGLSNTVQDQAVEEITKDKDKWVELMMKYELGLEKPDPKRATKSAFNIGSSYIVGGLIPLSPYFFVSNGLEGLKLSSIITLICLFIFGYLKSKFTGVNPWSGALRVMMIGAIAAGCAFGIARLIEHGGKYESMRVWKSGTTLSAGALAWADGNTLNNTFQITFALESKLQIRTTSADASVAGRANFTSGQMVS